MVDLERVELKFSEKKVKRAVPLLPLHDVTFIILKHKKCEDLENDLSQGMRETIEEVCSDNAQRLREKNRFSLTPMKQTPPPPTGKENSLHKKVDKNKTPGKKQKKESVLFRKSKRQAVALSKFYSK